MLRGVGFSWLVWLCCDRCVEVGRLESVGAGWTSPPARSVGELERFAAVSESLEGNLLIKTDFAKVEC